MARVLLILCFLFLILPVVVSLQTSEVHSARNLLAIYRDDLKNIRTERGGAYSLPNTEFYLFGMGNRRKFIFQNKSLKDPMTGQVIRQWPQATEVIINPSQYQVILRMPNQQITRITESEHGIIVEENGQQQPFAESPVKLPQFKGIPHAPTLKALHQEILVNIQESEPLSNFMTHRKASYRQAAVIAMALERTGNLELIQPWLARILEPFDMLNQTPDVDNLGEVLYLASLSGNSGHPIVDKVKSALPKYSKNNQLQGKTDNEPHPVFQTRWLRFGLRSLKLDVKPYVMPTVDDYYSTLTWWNKDDEQKDKRPRINDEKRPGYVWAEDHLCGTKRGKLSNRDYPLTWEIDGNQANHVLMKHISEDYVKGKIAAPHAYHAAEAFLLLLGNAKP